MSEFHLAQLNVGIPCHPADDPRMHGFYSMLDAVNALADQAPGFVWRLVGDGDNDATAVRSPLGPDVMVNMSVWESLETLRDYVYSSPHLDQLRQRAQWFQLPKDPFLVLWWVPAGHVPTVDEAVERLMLLRREGPGPRAFTFRRSYAPDALDDSSAVAV